MDYAIDKSTGAEINAAHGRRGARYKCPVCHADCHFRDGYEHRPHFAHNAGKASPDCENYFPGSTYATSGPQRERSLPYRTLNLYVHCPDVAANEPSWNLYLMIPEAPAGPGTIRIASGYRGTVNLPLTQIPGGGKRVQVIPQATPYKLDVGGSTDATYTSKFDKPVPGLKRAGCAVFRYSVNGGRRLSDDTPLYWGRAYFLVWQAGFAPDWWPLALWRRSLRPQAGWHCEMIELPADEDAQTIAWVERQLVRQVIQPPALISVVSPAGNRRLEDESVVIDAGSDIIIGVFGERGAFVPREIEWIGPGQRVAQRVALPNSLPAFVSLPRPDRGRLDIWISDQPESSLSLMVLQPPPIPLPSSVDLRIQDAEKNMHTIPLFTENAAAMLLQVRQKRMTLHGIMLPARLSGTIRTRRANDTGWIEHVLEPRLGAEDALQEPHTAFESRVTATIAELLSDKNTLVQLEFGNYGTITLQPHAKSLDMAMTVVLTPQQRHSIRWLLSIGENGGVPRSNVTMLASFADRFSLEEDRLLLYRLGHKRLWPPPSETHLRSLISSLNALLRR